MEDERRRNRSREDDRQQNRHRGISFLLGSAHPMVINGVEYTDEFWLKTADMLIVSSLVLIVVAIGAMAYGATNFMRRDHVR